MSISEEELFGAPISFNLHKTQTAMATELTSLESSAAQLLESLKKVKKKPTSELIYQATLIAVKVSNCTKGGPISSAIKGVEWVTQDYTQKKTKSVVKYRFLSN